MSGTMSYRATPLLTPQSSKEVGRSLSVSPRFDIAVTCTLVFAKRRAPADMKVLPCSFPSVMSKADDCSADCKSRHSSSFADPTSAGNVNLPEFVGLPGQVDIYLYHADSGGLVQQWHNINNYQGQVNVVANDSFWDYRMSRWQPGEEIPYTYYFVVVKAGTTLTGGEPRQATWTAIRE